MLIQEFSERTGIYPSEQLYVFIEFEYRESDLDMDAFCKAYKENENGLAKKIAQSSNIGAKVLANTFEREFTKKITELEKQVELLTAQLEREQEWKPYEMSDEVSQSDYEELAKNVAKRKTAHYMTDDEAKDLICERFDLDRNKITIIHEVDEYEVNRHNEFRKTGRKIDRRPVYCEANYYYIRFDTKRWSYEVWDDVLCPILDQSN